MNKLEWTGLILTIVGSVISAFGQDQSIETKIQDAIRNIKK